MNYLTNAYNQIQTKSSAFMNSCGIPADTKRHTGIAFVIGTVMTIIPTNNLSYSMRIGFFYATATALHGLVTPLFRKSFNANAGFSKEQEMLRGATALAGATLISKAINTPGYVNLFIGQVAFYALRLFFLHVKSMQSPTSSNIIAPIIT